MSKVFRIGRRRWLCVSFDKGSTIKGSMFGHRFRDGDFFLWCGWLRVLYTPQFW
jgi:hypothetical protein